MKPLSVIALVSALSAGQAAYAQDTGDWYVSLFAGYSNIGSIDTQNVAFDVAHAFDDSGMFGVTIGRTVQPGIRAELELSYATYEGGEVLYDGVVEYSFSEGDAATTFLMGNIWYDLRVSGFAGGTPYLGGGLGIVQLDADTTLETFDAGYGDSVTGVAYQFGGGFLFPVGSGMIDLAYRGKGSTGLDIGNNDAGSSDYEDGTFLSNTLQIGYVTQF